LKIRADFVGMVNVVTGFGAGLVGLVVAGATSAGGAAWAGGRLIGAGWSAARRACYRRHRRPR
jgi:hypothetical protein